MRQRGNIYVYGIIALLVIAAGTTAVLTYNHAIARAEQAEALTAQFETAFNEQLTENERLEASRKRLDTLLAARRRNDQATADKERQRDAALKKTRDSDPEARKWLDARVPDAILVSVRDDEATADQKGAKGNPAVGVAPTNAAPGVAGNDDKRRPFGLRSPAPPSTERVQ